MNSLVRASEVHEVAAVIEQVKRNHGTLNESTVKTLKPKPKPTKASRKPMVKSPILPPKKKKGHVHGICPQCGTIFHSTKAEHTIDCTQQIPVIMVRKNQTDRQLLEVALDALCRLITIWRDGCTCVLQETDGAKCGGDSQWGHVVPQGSCAFLIYNLSNSFRQCANHNGSHRFVQLTYHLWYQATFGKRALLMLERARIENPKYLCSTSDLRDKLAELNMLYDNRHSYSTATMEEKVEDGYYGPIIREAWIKEGRIPVTLPGTLSHSIAIAERTV